MKRIPATALVLGASLLLAACGTTVPAVGSLEGTSTGGLGTTGTTTGEGQGPELGGTTTGGGTGGVAFGTGGTTQPGTATGTPGGTSTSGDETQVGSTGAASTKPIQIGVLVTDTDSFKQATGSGESFTSLTRQAIHTYIKVINAAGGIAGRKLVVVDFTFNYVSANYDTEFEAACQKFTQDNHVSAVIYDGVTYNSVLNSCLTRAGVPTFFMHQVGTQVGDDTDLANNPGMITAGSPSIDRRLRTIMNGALAHGYLKAGSRIGVLVETCPYHVRAYSRTVAPIAARNKVTLFRTDIDCGAGSADHGTGIGAAQAAVLRYQTEGVDSIMYVTNYENGTVYYFAAAAEAQQYRPQYLLWHNQGCPACMQFWRDTGAGPQLEKVRGFGNSPLWEVTHPPAPTPAQAAVRKACMTTAKRNGIPAPTLNHQAIVYDTCDVVNLLRQALTLTGGQGGIRPVVSAVERLGRDFVSTMVLDGATRFGPGFHDGTAMWALSVYQNKCECIAYVTPPTPIQ